MQRQYVAIVATECEQVTARKMPELPRRVLNGERMLGGHHGFQDRKFGEHCGGARKLDFALTLDALESLYRTRQASVNLLCDFGLHGLAHHQQSGSYDRGD